MPLVESDPASDSVSGSEESEDELAAAESDEEAVLLAAALALLLDDVEAARLRLLDRDLSTSLSSSDSSLLSPPCDVSELVTEADLDLEPISLYCGEDRRSLSDLEGLAEPERAD